MISVTDSIKKAYDESTTQYDKIIVDNQEYFINNVQYEDDCYYEGNIFGTAIARTLEFEIENIIDLEEKEFKYLTGIKTENGIEWIDLGTFITQEVDPNDTSNINKVTAMDYMLKSNVEYISNLNYASGEITILQVLQEACQKAGITLATTDFANAGFIVDSNQFTEGSLIRQVFQAVAQISGTFAKVRYDDKLYLITPKRSGLKVKDVHKMKVKDLNKLPVSKLVGCKNKFKMNDYSELILKRNTHPINLVSLGMSDVEGENVVLKDEESIEEDGENSLVINDNPFAYTQAKREQLITALFNTVKGFEYTSYEITGQSKPYTETGDEVVVVDKDGTYSYSFLFRFNYKSRNGLESEMSAPSLTKATVNYQNVLSAEEIAKRTELIIDKQEQTITGIIEQQTEQGNKLTKVEQDIDSITQTVSSVETKVDQVEDKADNAQTSANNAQNTADSAVSQITTTNQKVTQIEQTIEGISQSVSDVEETIETVEQKADNAQSTADNINTNLATNYYNKTETNSQINQKANEITSTVSQTYSTKTETTNAKNEAIESANSSTDEKLQDYSTTEEMNSVITQSATSITSEVNQSINNIQVGGTNLIPNSAPYNLDDWRINNRNNIELTLENEETAPFGKCLRIRALKQLDSTSQWGIYITPTCKVLDTNKEYCFSIWLKATANTNATAGYSRGGQTTFAVTTSWQKFTYKFKPLAPTAESHAFWISLPAGTILGRQLFIHSIKLEEGNKNTAWSPSPDDDVKNVEFGTKIEQNAKNVQIAWNNESQNIRIENDNGNSTMGFYDNNTKFAEMGVNNVDNDRYISFAVPCNYNQSIADGMAWGIQTPDGAFHPILFIKNFHMGAQQSDDVYGELALRFCDLVLEGIESGIKSGNIKMYGNALNGLVFESDDGSQILSINPPDSNIPEWENGGLNILGNIEFYKNQGGTCSLKMSNNNDDNCCLFTNDGIITANILQLEDITVWGDGTISGPINFYTIPKYQNNPLVYGRTNNVYTMWWVAGKLEFWIDNTNVTANISDKRLKSDIKDVDEDLIKAINELEYKQFKRDNKGGLIGVGIIAQDLAEKLEKYGKKTDDYEILQQFQYKTDDDTLYYEVEDKQFLLLRLMAKEQEIKELQEKVNNQDEIIQDLLARVEKLEKEVKINE